MTIFRGFRRLLEAVQDLVEAVLDVAGALRSILEIQRAAGPAIERIEALELSRHQFEAECQGQLLQADGKLKAASNAEARERQLKRSYERIADEGDPAVEEIPDRVLAIDAEQREEERLSAMRLVVATVDRKAQALRAKWA